MPSRLLRTVLLASLVALLAPGQALAESDEDFPGKLPLVVESVLPSQLANGQTSFFVDVRIPDSVVLGSREFIRWTSVLRLETDRAGNPDIYWWMGHGHADLVSETARSAKFRLSVDYAGSYTYWIYATHLIPINDTSDCKTSAVYDLRGKLEVPPNGSLQLQPLAPTPNLDISIDRISNGAKADVNVRLTTNPEMQTSEYQINTIAYALKAVSGQEIKTFGRDNATHSFEISASDYAIQKPYFRVFWYQILPNRTQQMFSKDFPLTIRFAAPVPLITPFVMGFNGNTKIQSTYQYRLRTLAPQTITIAVMPDWPNLPASTDWVSWTFDLQQRINAEWKTISSPYKSDARASSDQQFLAYWERKDGFPSAWQTSFVLPKTCSGAKLCTGVQEFRIVRHNMLSSTGSDAYVKYNGNAVVDQSSMTIMRTFKVRYIK